MQPIHYIQQWDYHYNVFYQLVTGSTMIASAYLEVQSDCVILNSVYVQPEFRGNKFGNTILEHCIQYWMDKLDMFNELFLCVHRSNWVDKWYEANGFKFHSDKNDEYFWMVKDR